MGLDRQDKSATFNCGDIVVHPRKPQWGQGVVKQANAVTHQGKLAQRLAVEFSNYKRVVINTAVASLAFASDQKQQDKNMLSQKTSAASGWLDDLEKTSPGHQHELWGLPEKLTDPFASLEDKLKATLAAYKFSTESRSLIEWAVVQTGLVDPMTRYTRSQLEQEFPRFAHDRQQHLKQLVRKMKQQGHETRLQTIRAQAASPVARMALDKAMR